MRNLKRKLLERDPYCTYCPTKLTMETATLDHIIPRSKGGGSTKDNLVLACKPCNSKKGNKSVDSFLALIGKTVSIITGWNIPKRRKRRILTAVKNPGDSINNPMFWDH